MPLRFLIPLFAAFLALTSAAEQRQLAAGSVAPPLKPEKWIKGKPVESFEAGKLYLIECWATWCGPCVAAIPHLNKLHNRFQDQGLVVIGVNVMGDPEDKAAAFVARKGDQMAYRVAYDGKSGNISTEWLKAAGARGIPHAFLVRDGSLVWHGHPSALTEANISTVLKGGTLPAAPAMEPNPELVASRKARLEILSLLRQGEVDKALARITESERILAAVLAADPEVLRGMAFSIKGDREPSLSHYRKAVQTANGDPMALYRVSMGLLDFGSVRDPELALRCAREAAAKDANPVVRHLLARAEHAAGNTEKAIKVLETLVEEEDDETYRETLRALKQAKPSAPRGTDP